MSHRIVLGLMLWLACLVPTALSANQDPLARARDLYLSADYDEALAILNQLDVASPTHTTEVAEYRVFCLLALNRGAEARDAIERIVTAEPFYRPSEAQISPRIRAVFQSTRQAVLPGVIQKLYADAKAAFDKRDPQAVDQFDRVLALLDDPDLEPGRLADLRTVASGFRDLSRALAVVPAAPVELPSVAVPVLAVPATTPPPMATATVSADKISVSKKGAVPLIQPREPPRPGLVPPVVISQQVPRWSPPSSEMASLAFTAMIEVQIDEQGLVASATIRRNVHPTFDSRLLAAARKWKYKPATMNGVPIAFTKMIEIQLQPTR